MIRTSEIKLYSEIEYQVEYLQYDKNELCLDCIREIIYYIGDKTIHTCRTKKCYIDLGNSIDINEYLLDIELYNALSNDPKIDKIEIKGQVSLIGSGDIFFFSMEIYNLKLRNLIIDMDSEYQMCIVLEEDEYGM